MVNEVRDSLKERVSGGVLGTFSLFFITINWKIWIHLFSSVEPSFRIQAISRMILSHEFVLRFIAAILLTMAYLYFVPKMSRLVKEYEEEEQHKLELARINRRLRLNAHRKQIVEELDAILKYQEELQQAVEGSKHFVEQFLNFHKGYQATLPVAQVLDLIRKADGVHNLIRKPYDRLPKMRDFVIQTTKDLRKEETEVGT